MIAAALKAARKRERVVAPTLPLREMTVTTPYTPCK
jgi:hypothetical protein